MTTRRNEQAAPVLTFDRRELLWGIESEVAQISSLSRHIDEHVRAVNALRAQLTQQLHVLDEMVEVAQDGDLRSWLEVVAEPTLPQVTELFPDRLYTD